jgi:predicted permease
MNSLLQDLRFALRQLRRSPGFALIVVLALSLGIGAASAIFSVVETILLRPLPFAHQERLVSPFMKSRSGGSLPSSYLSYLDERSQLRTFQVLAGYSTFDRMNLEGTSEPISLRAVKTTDNFFDVFGVPPILGRTFRPGEDHPGNDYVVVLSYEVWKSSFNGRSDVIGTIARLDGIPYTIVGVMPAGFRFPMYEKEAIYTPLHAHDSWLKSRGMHWMRTVGLLKPGVTLQQAQADISTVMANLGRAYPEQEAGHSVSLYPLAAEVNGFGSDSKMKGPLRILTLAVLALLGIACINVAGLLLARGVKREREMALRTAIGASRGRLVRQLLSEGLVLSIAGLAGGVIVGWLLLKAMNVFLLEAIARGSDVHLNLTVAAFSLGLSLLITMAASLLPSLRLSGTNPGRAFHTGSSGSGVARDQHRLRSTFVVAQMALSLVLLVTSGLLLKNLQRLFKTDIGIDTKKLLVVPIDLSRGQYEKRDPLPAFYQPLLQKITHTPGVQAAGLIDMIPIAEWGNGYDIHITGQPPYPKDIPEAAETRFVSEGYFDAMGLKVTRGRLLSPSIDRPENPAGTMVVNEAFRRKFFSDGSDPVGAHIDDDPKPELKSGIVGVVTNVRQDLQQPPMPEMDWLVDSLPVDRRLDSLKNMFLLVRTHGDPQSVTPSIRQIMHDVDPTIPFREALTMDQVVKDQLVFERMEVWLFGIFATFALLLAIIGLYGLVQHEVETRTREIGIRMALGSTRVGVMLQIIRRVALLMTLGMVLGWTLTVALEKVIASVVELKAAENSALLVALTLALGLIGIATSLLPARRAATINPTEALRAE